MDNMEDRNPVNEMGVLSWLHMQRNETYSVNESRIGQQRLRVSYIADNGIMRSTGVKPICKIYGVFDLCFHVVEKLHAVAFNLKNLSEAVPPCGKKKTYLVVLTQ